MTGKSPKSGTGLVNSSYGPLVEGAEVLQMRDGELFPAYIQEGALHSPQIVTISSGGLVVTLTEDGGISAEPKALSYPK